MLFILIYILFILTYSTDGLIHDRSSIRIGAIYQEEELIWALKAAVEHINNDKNILTRYNLVAQSERVAQSDRDSFHACSKVCELMRGGVAAIFGPQSEFTAEHVQSVCDTMEVPHIETRWDTRQRRGAISVNLYPHPSTISKALFDLVTAWGWKGFTIIYEDEGGLIRVNELLKMYDPKGATITVRQLDKSNNYRPLLRRIKNTNEFNVLIDCSIQVLPEVLKQAQQVGLLSSNHNLIISCLDMHTIDLEPYQYGGTNITGMRLVDPNDMDVRNAAREIADISKNISITAENLRVETALVYDAVLLFASALRWLDHSQRVSVRPLNCETEENWEHGFSLINFMKVSETKGVTGATKFDHQGFRSQITLDLVELTNQGLVSIGNWNEDYGINLTRVYLAELAEHKKTQDVISLANKTLRVLTAISAPYGMLREASEKLHGNDRYEGFGIDLIQEISNMLGFNYTFLIQEDGQYGSLNKSSGQWTGMIRELQVENADLAITDLTITSERESAADFTMPFMNLGISILYRKPKKQAPDLFSFMSPFSNEVWVYMFITYVSVSVLLFLLARISPYEWTNPYPCIEDPDHLENQFSLRNSLWFTIGSLMQQGSDIAPTAVSTRMVAGIWWFFTLIMVSSYTANLAAFLTIESLVSPIKSLEDLANQNTIKYGAKIGGSTYSFFKDSNNTLHQRIWQGMNSFGPDVFTSSNGAGIEKVKKDAGKYAFFMESSSIEFIVERECELAQVGGLLDAKGYGIAMRKDSPYRNLISASVLRLQETGKIYALKVKWWKEKRGGGQCKDDAGSSGAASELGLANVGGVFVVLIVGVAFAAVVSIMELCFSVIQTTHKQKTPFWPELGSEMKFALKCKGSTKPVKQYKQDSSNDDDAAIEDTAELTENFTPLSPYASQTKIKTKDDDNNN